MVELTDKDALLILSLSSTRRALPVFIAGATAFAATTAVYVLVGGAATGYVSAKWITVAGGGVMLAYGAYTVKGILGAEFVGDEGKRLGAAEGGRSAFLSMVAALAALDLAGDATEVLTLVFAARYDSPVLVYSSALAGLVAATALQTALGTWLGRVLTRRRLRILSAGIFLALGSATLLAALA